MLIDHAKIYVFGGRGGKGCQSLYKDVFHRKGIPDGGDGGAGGKVVFIGDNNLNTLLDFKYNQHYCAGNGTHGGSNRKFGRTGEDLVVKVPVGTILKDADTNLVMRDIARLGETCIVAKGGAGGKGSAKLSEATEGDEGEERTLILELKLLADAGIIGFPNAGKSTLVSCISRAHSPIAPYPFTTRSPKLGVVSYHEETFVVADMPGLIEGAHGGRGLGDRFLRHIERTAVLVHMVDMDPLDGSLPEENYFKLEKELELYAKKVYDKPRIVVGNKMDMPGAEENLERLAAVAGQKVWPISAVKREGLPELIGEMYRKIENVKKGDEDEED